MLPARFITLGLVAKVSNAEVDASEVDNDRIVALPWKRKVPLGIFICLVSEFLLLLYYILKHTGSKLFCHSQGMIFK